MNLVDDAVVEQFEELADEPLREEKVRIRSNLRAEGFQSEVATLVQDDIGRAQRKDSMLTLLLDAFAPGTETAGVVSRSTNWEYRAFSLEVPGSPADADFTVFDLDDLGVGLLICLTDPTSVLDSLEDLRDLAAAAERNTSEIERQISPTGRTSIDPEEIFTVLSVTETHLEQIEDEFDRAAIQDVQEGSWMWELSITGMPRSLSVFTEFGPESSGSMSLSGDLDRELSEPVSIDRGQAEVNPDLFPSSHRYSKAQQLVRHLVSMRSESEYPNTHFTKSEAIEYLTGQENLAYNVNSDITEGDAVELLDWWKDVEIVSSLSTSQTSLPGSSQAYRFSVGEQKTSSIMNQVEQATKREIILEELDRFAMRKVLNGEDIPV